MSPSSTLTLDATGALVGAVNDSRQAYVERAPGACHSREVAAENGLVTSVVDGAACSL
ncbi:hypothetical protein WMF39_09945 [Sorangium sp. So ce1504]|uniref:hypothetical protein n=1 Tax=Sorangium sp. So ce1504 TaxID=3133337 RepID=UPI003F6367EA